MLGLALAAVLAAGPAGTAAGARGPGLQAPGLQLPGMFHGDETVARDGERWLALVDGTGGARLREVRVSVKPAHDPVLDDADGRSGRIVESVPGLGGGVVAYVRGPGLRARPVVRAAVGEPSGAPPGPGGPATVTLRLGARTYRLETQCEPDPAIRDAYRCAIVLIEGARRQALVEMAGTRVPDAGIALGDDAAPHLIFAGDLDGDGALDLIYDATDHYNVAAPTLFLSGGAGADELLRAVAAHRTTGC